MKGIARNRTGAPRGFRSRRTVRFLEGGEAMATLRGEEIIAHCLKREGVDTIFFMMGGPTGGTAGACLNLGMKGIYVRHEQAAAMMAHAYARITGKPGVCIAPMGPGVANLVTGLANA